MKRGSLIPLGCLCLSLSLSLACSTLPEPPAAPATLVMEEEPSPEPAATTAEPTVTTSSSITPDRAPAPVPNQAALITRSCDGSDVTYWCLLYDGVYQDLLHPFDYPHFTEFAPLTQRVLMSSSFPDHGAGPGNKAVSDLVMIELGSMTQTFLVVDEIVVRARWADNGLDLAYIRALPDHYELVWRDGLGAEKILAHDATFVFGISPDATRVAFTREEDMGTGPGIGLYVVNVASGAEQYINTIDRSGGGSVDDRPIWSADGEYILLSMLGIIGPSGMLHVNSDGSGSAMLSYSDAVPENLRPHLLSEDTLWHPDNNHLIAYLSTGEMNAPGNHYVVLYDIDNEARQITAATILATNVRLAGWDRPGQSIWVGPLIGDSSLPYIIPLP